MQRNNVIFVLVVIVFNLLLVSLIVSADSITGYFVVKNVAPTIEEVKFSQSPTVFAKNEIPVFYNGPVFVRVKVVDPNGLNDVLFVEIDDAPLTFDGQYWRGNVTVYTDEGVQKFHLTARDDEHTVSTDATLKVIRKDTFITGSIIGIESILAWFSGFIPWFK